MLGPTYARHGHEALHLAVDVAVHPGKRTALDLDYGPGEGLISPEPCLITGSLQPVRKIGKGKENRWPR
jgi:hypothetical protein